MLKLGDGDGEARSLVGLPGLARAAHGRQPRLWPRVVPPRRGSGGVPATAGRAVRIDRPHQRGLLVVRPVGGEQVGEHHGTGQVGDVLVADHPAALGLPHHDIVAIIGSVRPVFSHRFYLPLPKNPGASPTLPAET
jgi:hypothetical protein